MYSFPFTYTREIPNSSAAFTISNGFTYSETTGYHTKQVSCTSVILAGVPQLKMQSLRVTHQLIAINPFYDVA
jgi:hypothetical protein